MFQSPDPVYSVGGALAALTKAGAAAGSLYSMAGRLHLSRGWLVLTVPASLVRGAFDAIHEPGIELPPAFAILVMAPEELTQIGGADKVTERGHSVAYSLGGLHSSESSSPGVSRVWYLSVTSPDLRKIRTSYGLSPFPSGDGFQLPVAVRPVVSRTKLAECLQEPDWEVFDESLVKAAAGDEYSSIQLPESLW